MIKCLAHICIESEDLPKTEWFYREVLGFTRKFDFIKEGELFGFYFEINDSNFIEVFHTGKLPEGASKVKHFCLEVDDIDAIEQTLTDNGIETWSKKLGPDHTWQVWCQDPSGIDIEFQQYTEKSSQLTGEACLVNW